MKKFKIVNVFPKTDLGSTRSICELEKLLNAGWFIISEKSTDGYFIYVLQDGEFHSR